MFTEGNRSQVKQYQGKGFRPRQIQGFNKFHQLSFDYLLGCSTKPEDGIVSTTECCSVGQLLHTGVALVL